MLDVAEPANWNRKQLCDMDSKSYKIRKPTVVNIIVAHK